MRWRPGTEREKRDIMILFDCGCSSISSIEAIAAVLELLHGREMGWQLSRQINHGD
jgi:hypothetical protein